MDLRFEAQLTVDDFIAAQRLHAGHTRMLTFCLTTAVIVVAVCWALHATDAGSLAGAAAMFVLWVSIFWGTYSRRVAGRAARIFARQPNLELAYHIEITDERLVMCYADRGSWTIPWRDFYQWKSGATIVLAYQTAEVFRIFPRRWFASDADFAGFKELLAKTIGPAGKARQTLP